MCCAGSRAGSICISDAMVGPSTHNPPYPHNVASDGPDCFLDLLHLLAMRSNPPLVITHLHLAYFLCLALPWFAPLTCNALCSPSGLPLVYAPNLHGLPWFALVCSTNFQCRLFPTSLTLIYALNFTPVCLGLPRFGPRLAMQAFTPLAYNRFTVHALQCYDIFLTSCMVNT
jgi:hypothetical protein